MLNIAESEMHALATSSQKKPSDGLISIEIDSEDDTIYYEATSVTEITEALEKSDILKEQMEIIESYGTSSPLPESQKIKDSNNNETDAKGDRRKRYASSTDSDMDTNSKGRSSVQSNLEKSEETPSKELKRRRRRQDLSQVKPK